MGSCQNMEGTRPEKESWGGREMNGFAGDEGGQDRLLNPIKCLEMGEIGVTKSHCGGKPGLDQSPCMLAGSCCTDSGHMLCNSLPVHACMHA